MTKVQSYKCVNGSYIKAVVLLNLSIDRPQKKGGGEHFLCVLVKSKGCLGLYMTLLEYLVFLPLTVKPVGWHINIFIFSELRWWGSVSETDDIRMCWHKQVLNMKKLQAEHWFRRSKPGTVKVRLPSPFLILSLKSQNLLNSGRGLNQIERIIGLHGEGQESLVDLLFLIWEVWFSWNHLQLPDVKQGRYRSTHMTILHPENHFVLRHSFSM